MSPGTEGLWKLTCRKALASHRNSLGHDFFSFEIGITCLLCRADAIAWVVPELRVFNGSIRNCRVFK